MRKPLEDIHEDLALAVECARNMTTRHPKALYEPVVGGYTALKPQFRPIYFADAEYRKRRHALVVRLLEDAEREIASKGNDSAVEEPADDDAVAALDASLAAILGTVEDDDDDENADGKTDAPQPT